MSKFKLVWASAAFFLASCCVLLINIMYTDRHVDGNNQISCPIYSILDRPVATTDSPDVKKIREAIHDVRVKYNCPPPLIPSPTTVTTHGH